MEADVTSTILCLSFITACSLVVVFFSFYQFKNALLVESAATRSLALEAFVHFKSANAEEAAKAKAFTDRSAVEIEMLKNVLREQQQAKKIQKPEAPQELIIDGRVVEAVSIDDVLGSLE